MLRHALREDVPANAVPGAPAPELLAGVATSNQGLAKLREAIDAAKAAKRWQKSVKPVLDVLVTFSHRDGEGLGESSQADYFRQALAFVQERFGGSITSWQRPFTGMSPPHTFKSSCWPASGTA